MGFYKMLILTYLAISNALDADFGHKFRGNFWQSLAPGELLNALDLMTIDDAQNQKPFSLITTNASETTTSRPSTTNAPKTIPKPRHTEIIATPRKRMITSDDNSAASTSNEQDDYERTYEQFVRRYFDDAADHYISNEHDGSNSGEDASNFSSETSYESEVTTPLDAQPLATATKSKNSKRECRKIRKKREVCIICKNPRNGERSETCSYERASDPESYAYEKERKYKKSRDRSEPNSKSSEESAESKAESKILKLEKAPKAAEEASSSCIKRLVANKACYNCKNSAGVTSVKCFPLKVSENNKKSDIKKRPSKIENNTHQKRRIYKRTLSYVYEKGLDSNETLTSPEDLNGNFTESLKSK